MIQYCYQGKSITSCASTMLPYTGVNSQPTSFQSVSSDTHYTNPMQYFMNEGRLANSGKTIEQCMSRSGTQPRQKYSQQYMGNNFYPSRNKVMTDPVICYPMHPPILLSNQKIKPKNSLIDVPEISPNTTTSKCFYTYDIAVPMDNISAGSINVQKEPVLSKMQQISIPQSYQGCRFSYSKDSAFNFELNPSSKEAVLSKSEMDGTRPEPERNYNIQTCCRCLRVIPSCCCHFDKNKNLSIPSIKHPDSAPYWLVLMSMETSEANKGTWTAMCPDIVDNSGIWDSLAARI